MRRTEDVFPNAALMQHIAILGKTGSGKTSTGKLLVEQVVGHGRPAASGYRVCILDPIKSDWWGITSSADGKSEGMPFAVLGGPRGHVPLNAGAGRAVGELVGRGDLPLSVVDMADFEAGGVQRFFCDFADSLLKNVRGVVYLVLEEAHEFAPKERAGFDKENLAIHYAKKLATAGRSKGIRLVVMTQRTQALHNAVLGSCDSLVAHRFTAPADQEPIVKWLKANTPKDVAAEVAGSLSSLKTGSGWFCSGEAGIFERRQFPRIQTFDNSATPTNDVSTAHLVRAESIDLPSKLADVITQAMKEADANDPLKLRARIRGLESELARRPEPNLEQSLARGEEVRELRAAVETSRQFFASSLRHTSETLDAIATSFATLQAYLATVQKNLSESPIVVDVRDRAVVASIDARPSSSADRHAFSMPARRVVDHVARPAGMAKADAAVLRALYWLRNEERSPEKVAFFAGYSASSSSYSNALGALRSEGLVAGWSITKEGIERIGITAGDKPSGRDLRDWLRPKLGRAENAMLDALVKARGIRLSNEDLSANCGYPTTSSSFSNALGKLRSIGAAEGYEKDGGTRVAAVFL